MSTIPSPRNAPMRHFFRWLKSVFFYEHWMVGIIDAPLSQALEWTEAPPIRWIAPFDKNFYLADPFPWPHSDDTIVCEEYDLLKREGHIVVLRLGANGVIGKLKIDLPIKGHLSFPFLFLHEGHIFAMPESSSAKTLQIFKWSDQTGLWTLYSTVFDNMSVADAALWRRDGVFWISYTNIHRDPHDNLNLVYSSTLEGPWLRHPLNPVQKGRDLSRNAGGVFEVMGKLYRPAQDCTSVYGGALRIMQISTCTPSAYEEHEVTRIVPSARTYPDGLHSLVGWGDKCLVDGMRLVFSPRLVWSKLCRRLSR